MNLSKDGYPQGPLLRAVWECCDELYEKLGRAPSRQEFYNEIDKREPHRIGISTHSRQWGEWMRHHNFSTYVASVPGIIPALSTISPCMVCRDTTRFSLCR